ncbi:citrate lyase subunit gamma (acyl carrier protein) [Geoalkalibacter ferrihydriticus]|uniref:Citrate lyase subunit gamma n=2 Tax=Geoalkalibacter ferrihydriticus TaxID=392333 RepID=A0A0C2DQP4_9BACT|nr:citrate lyase acyl carrier protein [Geoalkalibacter ferrihydriticus]KIH75744.1 citrate lyase subunit gamma [Geoalkalibacter ferrihydriticus DSM 17813]SDM63061.1 citrate lyase subunit gamma (acyl carrier protein) [Geoalkalibacter ferrihydriticus]
MEIRKKVQAGTLQSSDLMVFVEPADTLSIEIQSTVKKQFEHLIRARIDAVLERLQVSRGLIRLSDRGALDYAIEARLEAALRRAAMEG